MPKDAIFSIASMTKPIVTVAALMLYEEGRLMVNEPVAKYLPKLSRMRVGLPGCDGSPAQTVEAAREMTIQDLMRHTAGVSYGRGDDAASRDLAGRLRVGGSEMDGRRVHRAHRCVAAAFPAGLGVGIQPRAGRARARDRSRRGQAAP